MAVLALSSLNSDKRLIFTECQRIFAFNREQMLKGIRQVGEGEE